MSDVTILVNSCDKYEDVWEPFFRLLKIHWPECENYRIILNTETKVYNCDFLDVETICGGKEKTWSERLKYVLDHIKTDYLVYFLEDFFLLEKVSNETFLEAVNLIKNGDIGYIGLKYQAKRDYRNPDDEYSTDRFVEKDKVITMNRVNSMTALWDKAWLLSLIRKHETPWEFEIYGSIRSRRTSEKVLIINNSEGMCPCVFNYNVDIHYGHGLTLGQWLPKNKELFDKYGIEVNFDNLGINYELYENAIRSTPPCSIGTDSTKQQPLDLRERLYNIKKWPKKQKKKIVKTIRKIRSLI